MTNKRTSMEKVKARIKKLDPPIHIRKMAWILFHHEGEDAAMNMLDYYCEIKIAHEN
jgi:hypothetical protein